MFDLGAAQSLTNDVAGSDGVASLQKEVGVRRDTFHLQLFQQVSRPDQKKSKGESFESFNKVFYFLFFSPKQ